MDDNDASQWFGEYLNAFAACGAGESDTEAGIYEQHLADGSTQDLWNVTT